MSDPISFCVGAVVDDPDQPGGIIARLRPLIETETRRSCQLKTAIPDHVEALHAGQIVTIAIGDPDGPYYTNQRLVIDLGAQSVRMPRAWDLDSDSVKDEIRIKLRDQLIGMPEGWVQG